MALGYFFKAVLGLFETVNFHYIFCTSGWQKNQSVILRGDSRDLKKEDDR